MNYTRKAIFIITFLVIAALLVTFVIITKGNMNFKSESGEEIGINLPHKEQARLGTQIKPKGVEAAQTSSGEIEIVVSAGTKDGGPSRVISVGKSGVKLKSTEIIVDVIVDTLDTMETSPSNPQLSLQIIQTLPKGTYKITSVIHERDGFSQRVYSTTSVSTALTIE